MRKVSPGDFVASLAGSRRWWTVWFLLLGLSAALVPYFDTGAPVSLPGFLRAAVGIFLAPGGLIWMALFWAAFGGGPTDTGRMFIVLVNSIAWLFFIYAAIRITGWLRTRRQTG